MGELPDVADAVRQVERRPMRVQCPAVKPVHEVFVATGLTENDLIQPSKLSRIVEVERAHIGGLPHQVVGQGHGAGRRAVQGGQVLDDHDGLGRAGSCRSGHPAIVRAFA